MLQVAEPDEWAKCLRLVAGGEAHLLCRHETDWQGNPLKHYEMLLTHQFNSGVLKLLLTRVKKGGEEETGGEEGRWLINAMQIKVSPDYKAADPLETWYSCSPLMAPSPSN